MHWLTVIEHFQIQIFTFFSSDAQQGYKNTKARLGMRRVRPWVWVQFCNPARKDGALLWHWRRQADQGKDYPFAQFDKVNMIIAPNNCWNNDDIDD